MEQLSDPGRNTLSPTEAAARAGVSVRTVHLYFPNLQSQVTALSEWFDRHLNPAGITPAAGPGDLPRYFREIHANALASPLSRALATSSGEVWQTVRRSRRSRRLNAIRAAVQAVGAPAQATAEATAMVLRLSGADASWPLHDNYGLPLERIPDVIAHTIELIIRDLRTHVTDNTHPPDPRVPGGHGPNTTA